MISFIGMIFGLVIAAIVKKVGFRSALILGIILGAIVSFWQASLPTFSMLLISRVVEGLSHLLIVVSAPMLMVKMTVGRKRSMS